jgi:hydrogenase expression/formation protein HypC
LKYIIVYSSILLPFKNKRLETEKKPMCLAVPAKVTSIEGSTATVSVLGNTTTADISLLENIRAGDYVLVHAGFAIQKYDEEEAKITLELLKELAQTADNNGPR